MQEDRVDVAFRLCDMTAAVMHAAGRLSGPATGANRSPRLQAACL